MSIPTWSPGEVLTSSDVNSWFVPLAAVKAGDTGRASNTSVTNDPDLQLSLVGGATYEYRMAIIYKGFTNGSSDMQAQVNAPASATGFSFFLRHQITSLTFNDVLNTTFGVAVNVGTNGTSNVICLNIWGTVVTSGAGTLAFAWAQNTSSGTATTVMATSALLAQRLV
jgi:hypothetical protein